MLCNGMALFVIPGSILQLSVACKYYWEQSVMCMPYVAEENGIYTEVPI